MNKMKETKGITLIALVITIIVLLILAGITIALIAGQDSAPDKAVQARTENDKGAVRDAVTMLVAEKISDYYEGKYVNSSTDAKYSGTKLAYLESELASGKNVTTNGYKVVVADGTITATKTGENTAFVEGTVSAEGIISWGGSSSGGQTAGGPTIVGDDAPTVGESVNYNPGSLSTASVDLPEGAEIEKTKVAAVTLPRGATFSSNATASGATDWKILDYDEDTGEVLITPTGGTLASLTLEGMDGYNNAIEALDAVAGIYLNGEYAKSARSITVEDINTIEDYDPYETETAATNTGTYNWNHRYSMDANLNIVDNGEGNEEVERTYVVNPSTGYYMHGTENSIFSDMSSCWLASRCVYLDSNNCYFSVRYFYVSGAFVNSYGLFIVCSDGSTGTNYNTYEVRPVVSLKSGVTMEKNGSGVWQLSI